MQEQFADDARLVIMKANEEAAKTTSAFIGTQHLLLALIQLTGHKLLDALKSKGLTKEKIVEVIKANEAYSEADVVANAPRLKAVIDNAIEITDNVVEIEHILAALLNDKDSHAYKITATLLGDSIVEALLKELNSDSVNKPTTFDWIISTIKWFLVKLKKLLFRG